MLHFFVDWDQMAVPHDAIVAGLQGIAGHRQCKIRLTDILRNCEVSSVLVHIPVLGHTE